MGNDATPSRLRRILLAVGGTGLLLVVLAFAATRPLVMNSLLERVLDPLLGGPVEVQGATLRTPSLLTVESLTLRANGIGGDAGTVLVLRDVAVKFSGVFDIERVYVTDGLLRLAEDASDPSRFNFTALQPQSDDDGASAGPPGIDITALRVETGTFDASGWHLEEARVVGVGGRLEADGRWVFGVTGSEGLALYGALKMADGESSISVDATTLDNQLFGLLPPASRAWMETLSLEGRVDGARVSWDEKGIRSAAVDLDDIRLRLPRQLDVQWSHFADGAIVAPAQRPYMHVTDGSIDLDRSALRLDDLTGTLLGAGADSAPVPFRANISVHDLPPLDTEHPQEWAKGVLDTAPFDIRLDVERFESTDSGSADLPQVAARVLELFEVRDWRLSLQLHMQRSETSAAPEISGQMLVSGGSGRYAGFPYPLAGVQAAISLEGDDVVLESLRATGSKDAEIFMRGTLSDLSSAPSVDLVLNARNAPLDDALRSALSPALQRLMDRAFSVSRIRQLHAAGVLPDTPLITEMAERAAALTAQLAGSDLPAVERDRLRLQRDQAQAMSRMEPFGLGGTIDLDLSIRRGGGDDAQVAVDGDVVLHEVGIVHEAFPYPLIVGEGTLHVFEGGIQIDEDDPLPVRGPGGGVGFLAGRVDWGGGGSAAPGLEIVLQGELISPTLVEAVSLCAGDAYERAVGLLGGLGLLGRVSTSGHIGAATVGAGGVDFAVEITEGSLMLQPSLAATIGASGPFWPEAFAIEDLAATIAVDGQGVQVTQATGTFEGGGLDAAMTIAGGDLSLEFESRGFPVDPRLIGLLPAQAAATFAPAWGVLSPHGRADARCRITRSGGEHHLRLEAVATELAFHIGGEIEVLTPTGGAIVVDGNEVRFEDLRFGARHGGIDDGTIALRGSVRVDEDARLEFEGGWVGGQAGLPMVRAITRIAGGQGALRLLDRLSPQGRFDADVEVSGNAGSMDYAVRFEPASFQATFGDRRIDVDLDAGEALLVPGELRLVDFNGRLGKGAFAVGGTIETADGLDGALQLDWRGPSDDPSLLTILPSGVESAFEAISLSGGEARLDGGVLAIRGSSIGSLDVTFDGGLEVTDVSLVAGIPMERIRGRIDIHGSYAQQQFEAFDLDLSLHELTVAGRRIRDIDGGLHLRGGGAGLQVGTLRGRSGQGAITLDGRIGVGDDLGYEVAIMLAGVALGQSGGDDAVAHLEGELDGWFSVAGQRGEDASRRGRGRLRVVNGKLASVPAALRALQLLQLAPALNAVIDWANIDLYVDGPTIILDRIELASLEEGEDEARYFEVLGSGTIDFDTLELSARLRPRSGWAGIRDLVGILSDQVFGIEIKGPLLNPTVSVLPLPFLHSGDQ